MACIVTAREPTPTVQHAVRELNEHLKLCTGVALPVVKDGDPVPGAAIPVGRTALTARYGLVPDLLPLRKAVETNPHPMPEGLDEEFEELEGDRLK